MGRVGCGGGACNRHERDTSRLDLKVSTLQRSTVTEHTFLNASILARSAGPALPPAPPIGLLATAPLTNALELAPLLPSKREEGNMPPLVIWMKDESRDCKWESGGFVSRFSLGI